MQHERHWTLAEANASLAYVGSRIDELRALTAVVESPEAADGFARAAEQPGGGWPGAVPAEAAVRLDMRLRELQALGIVVRDLEQGLVDFPALRDGEEIYLCWLRDEPAVTHYHASRTGFAGRRKL